MLGPSLRWNSEMTTLLIKIRGEMDREFAKAKYKFRLWQKVAAKLKLHNIEVSAKDCDDKWRNIVATYRKNIDKLKCFGDNTVRWEYFTAMDNILKGTKDVADQFSISSIVEEDHVVKLMNELTSPEVEVKSEPFEIIDVRYRIYNVKIIYLYLFLFFFLISKFMYVMKSILIYIIFKKD